MKRISALLLCLLFLLCGCSDTQQSAERETLDIAGIEDCLDLEEGIFDNNNDFFLGAWLSYLELPGDGDCKDEESYRAYIGKTADNLQKLGVNHVFVHVRPFCDAIYPSELFVPSACVAGERGKKLPFDYFGVIIEQMQKRDIAVHAWLNPFRVQKQFDEASLCENETATVWLLEKSENIKVADGGLYLNPASQEVRQFVVNGVRELMSSYALKGIHIDDYFYPTTDQEFDSFFYKEYQNGGGTLSLSQWRKENISTLLSQIYSTVKSYGADKMFSVSPSGSIEKNENELYADVSLWCAQDGYCDMIIPQIYFGFENESKPFDSCALLWKKLWKNSAQMCLGLALYKAGNEDGFAGTGEGEWQENCDIIARQAAFAKENGFSGICLYSASFVNFNETSSGKETQNLYDVLS